MTDTTEHYIEISLENQRRFFATNRTKDLDFRAESLRKLKNAIKKYESRITGALKEDLNKSYEEAWLTEISIVTQEIDNHLKNMRRWARPRKVKTPLHLLPSSGRIYYEPLGVALIIAPWNYPFQVLFAPLVGAISAGCCVMLKPSPYTPATAKVMEEMVHETFSPEYIDIVQGGRHVNAALLRKRWDFIFYTGSTEVGRVIMKAAAEHLTPVVLELGGKSPCIVDRDADINLAAKRIAWGKSINAGQTCIAPDYVLVHSSVKEQLIEKLGEAFKEMFGSEQRKKDYYPHIVNHQAFDRLEAYIGQGTVRYGGERDRRERFMGPVVIDSMPDSSPVMKDEIFGPVLPVLPFGDISEAVSYVNSHEKPLALYYFGRNSRASEILSMTTSGGGCINDTLLHIANHHLPFGGVGASGMGKYHGEETFRVFSNARSVVSSPTWIDLPFKYVPFRYFKLLKKII